MNLTIRKDLYNFNQQNQKIENIHKNPIVTTVARKEPEKECVMDNIMENNPSQKNKKRHRKTTEEEEKPEEKIFSNDMRDACKTVCRICQAAVFLTTMRGHTRSRHKVPIEEYKAVYGNHRTMIKEKVYHKCGICAATILLDSDEISHHLKKNHSISHKNYNEEYMVTRKTEKKEMGVKSNARKEDSISSVINHDEMMAVTEDENSSDGSQEEDPLIISNPDEQIGDDECNVQDESKEDGSKSSNSNITKDETKTLEQDNTWGPCWLRQYARQESTRGRGAQ